MVKNIKRCCLAMLKRFKYPIIDTDKSTDNFFVSRMTVLRTLWTIQQCRECLRHHVTSTTVHQTQDIGDDGP